MFYREAGQFKTSYGADQALFPLREDRYFVVFCLLIAFFVVPFFLTEYRTNALILPFLIHALAALGLNILVGYCGQISLGTGAFMAVGAYCSYKLMVAFPGLDYGIIVLISGLVTALVGTVFGLPSLRVKGFYLAVATLAAQFFLIWLFNKVGWFFNYSASGLISAPPRDILGFQVTGPGASIVTRYLVCLSFLALFALVARNIIRGRIGRAWMSIRDMDIAAELMGVSPLRAKLSAFAVSSFYIGMAGSLYFAVWLGSVEPTEAFDILRSFEVLFMIIIGGLGSILGAILGAGFITLLPVFLKNILVDGFGISPATGDHLNFMIVGGLIIFFLVVEPKGLARLYAIVKEKMRLWPFAY